MALERHMYLASRSFARLSLITKHKKQHKSINCYKLPTFSERVSEVGLFQGSTLFSGDSPRGGPRGTGHRLEDLGCPMDEGPGASAWSFWAPSSPLCSTNDSPGFVTRENVKETKGRVPLQCLVISAAFDHLYEMQPNFSKPGSRPWPAPLTFGGASGALLNMCEKRCLKGGDSHLTLPHWPFPAPEGQNTKTLSSGIRRCRLRQNHLALGFAAHCCSTLGTPTGISWWGRARCSVPRKHASLQSADSTDRKPQARPSVCVTAVFFLHEHKHSFLNREI